MVVRIRLGRGPRVAPSGPKNRRVALAFAALLTPAAMAALVLSVWRIGADLGVAGQFAIGAGLFSHWQVWLAVALCIQALAIFLNRYGARASVPPFADSNA